MYVVIICDVNLIQSLGLSLKCNASSQFKVKKMGNNSECGNGGINAS